MYIILYVTEHTTLFYRMFSYFLCAHPRNPCISLKFKAHQFKKVIMKVCYSRQNFLVKS